MSIKPRFEDMVFDMPCILDGLSKKIREMQYPYDYLY